ncbi:hypothetical protein CTA2_9309, partial [Colletotrichum tanaceti]
MHQQTLRSVGSRIKPDVVAIKTCIRTFSTTQSRAADEPSSNNKNRDTAARTPRAPLSTGRERSRAAASEIGQILRGGPRAGGADKALNYNAGASATAAKPNLIDIKTLPNREGSGGTNFVKLPQGFGRGGRGAFAGGRGRDLPSGLSAGGIGRGGFTGGRGRG